MKKADFVILCLKLLGIYFFVIGISSLSSALAVILQSGDSKPYFSIGPIMYIVAGSILFVSAKRISIYILEFSETDDDNIQIMATEQTARIAFIILGIFIFSHALPQLVQLALDVGLYYVRFDEIPKHLREQQHRWTIIIAPVVKLLIAMVLIIGPDKIIGFIAKYDETFKNLKASSNDIE
jgi:hypothetical protein